ncbi:hypothetical protein LWI29_000121 [Acer saccharum]|uniref:Uncharacterized protein n=1 Tax=Acer saccharum TaxID=4024 RepID=A0AA39W7X6_ACESA|nr:hypothetical protein LWI29_000121 [Acer saccharum]
MGVIKDGTVSGYLPSSEAFAVHYPGYPSSTSRAIQTLGGTQSIIKARSSQSNKLELHFRPEDPFSHPAFGELRPYNGLLLKISKKKSCNFQSAELSNKISENELPDATDMGHGQEVGHPDSKSVAAEKEVDAQISEENHVNLSADIVARVSEAYYFDGMADYQHVVAVHADVARRKKRNWTEVEQPLSGKDGLKKLDEDDVMMLLPPLFSPKDVPENVVLRPSVIPSSRKKEGVVQNSVKTDIESGLAIDFNIKDILCLIPKKVNGEELISRDSEQWKGKMAVSKLFDERPIWPKNSIIDRLLDEGQTYNNKMLKRHLLGIAYYFSNGPFLKFWIRKGYDPRKDPDSRIYQRMDFRVKPWLLSYCDASTDTELKCRWKDLCAFQVFPTKCSTLFQLYELADDYIQQEIRKPPKQTTCSLKTGWFSESMFDAIRKRMDVRFISVYPGPGAKKLLKTASEAFEKLKKECIYKDALQPDQEEHQEFNKGVRGDDDKEKPEIVDDDEEDKIEVDEAEEESDADEAPDPVAEDEVSMQSHSYMDLENNSRTYLQELFDSFPSSEVGAAKMQDDEISDGEYQIFEQDSDGSYFDDGDN